MIRINPARETPEPPRDVERSDHVSSVGLELRLYFFPGRTLLRVGEVLVVASIELLHLCRCEGDLVGVGGDALPDCLGEANPLLDRESEHVRDAHVFMGSFYPEAGLTTLSSADRTAALFGSAGTRY